MRARCMLLVAAALLLGILVTPARLMSQDGDAWAIVGGAALGATSGAILGAVGGVMPCGYALSPSRCSGTWALAGAAVAGVAGSQIGRIDRGRLSDLGRNAAIGLAAGAALGTVLIPVVDHYQAEDVLALGLIGGAVGASPIGSAIGFGLGFAGGTLLWLLVDGVTMQDALQTALLGLAVGGISGWAANALDAQLVLPGLQVAF